MCYGVCRCVVVLCFFFFQAEDGIRDSSVTGVQTCALPISGPIRCLPDRVAENTGCQKLPLAFARSFPRSWRICFCGWAQVPVAMIRGMIAARPAGFWIRALAFALDVAIFLIVRASYRAVARRFLGVAAADEWTLAPMLGLFTLLFAAAYTIVLHTLFGQTIGKLVVGIPVAAHGEPPPVGAPLLRFSAYFPATSAL